MVIALLASVALSEVSVLGCPFLSGWSLQGVTPMKEQLSVFSTARRPPRQVVETYQVEWVDTFCLLSWCNNWRYGS